MFSALDLAVSEFACFDQIVSIAQEVYNVGLDSATISLIVFKEGVSRAGKKTEKYQKKEDVTITNRNIPINAVLFLFIV